MKHLRNTYRSYRGWMKRAQKKISRTSSRYCSTFSNCWSLWRRGIAGTRRLYSVQWMWWLSRAIEGTKTQVEGIKSTTLPSQQTSEWLELIQHNPTPHPPYSCFLLLFQDWHQQHLRSTSAFFYLEASHIEPLLLVVDLPSMPILQRVAHGSSAPPAIGGQNISTTNFFIAWWFAPVDQSGTWYGRHWNLKKNCPNRRKSMQEGMQSHMTKIR